MPKITISNQGQKVVDYKLNNETPLSILAIMQENNIDWMHACGGNGRCTSCKCDVIEGGENLAANTEVENSYMESSRLQANQRLACQAIPTGDVLISVPEKNKVSGVDYTS